MGASFHSSLSAVGEDETALLDLRGLFCETSPPRPERARGGVFLSQTDTGSASSGPWFFTLPTALLIRQSVMRSAGKGFKSAVGSPIGSSPNHAGTSSSPTITGIRLCSGATKTFGSVVMIVQERTGSPSRATTRLKRTVA
jgi:hypothetical protein